MQELLNLRSRRQIGDIFSHAIFYCLQISGL
jgi:hypothetical protein